ncbi:MAG: Hsp20 family protein, partial [Alphaproteobacteria bacterium]|nr:Hsp20 family protein [Alphaproteobacteria bacterium]
YRITMAVAGFTDADIELTVKDNTLVVQGNPLAEREGVNYLHHGIAGRGFERRFELAENVKVVGARLENGMLHVDLVRETPEHMKPRRIEINSAAA